MKQHLYVFPLLLVLFGACTQEVKQKETLLSQIPNSETISSTPVFEERDVIHPEGTTLRSRIHPPINFKRTEAAENSYAEYLRNLPLKPHGTTVQFYNGQTKPNYNTYAAVVDLEIGNKNLHQCADAIMRLRAEYLWTQKKYEDIHFNFTNGFRVDYSQWMKGKRMVVNGNKTYWVDKSSPSNTYQDFWKYMELIFNYAGTLSLSKELISVEIQDIKIGDVFIQGGSPGHAILVVDIAESSLNKEKVFLLAQSYMPAQETQILQNPNNKTLSPWYSLSEIHHQLTTPEWTFNATDLKRFHN